MRFFDRQGQLAADGYRVQRMLARGDWEERPCGTQFLHEFGYLRFFSRQWTARQTRARSWSLNFFNREGPRSWSDGMAGSGK